MTPSFISPVDDACTPPMEQHSTGSVYAPLSSGGPGSCGTKLTEAQREAAIVRAIDRQNTHIQGRAECERLFAETKKPLYQVFSKAHLTRIEECGRQISQLMAARSKEIDE